MLFASTKTKAFRVTGPDGSACRIEVEDLPTEYYAPVPIVVGGVEVGTLERCRTWKLGGPYRAGVYIAFDVDPAYGISRVERPAGARRLAHAEAGVKYNPNGLAARVRARRRAS